MIDVTLFRHVYADNLFEYDDQETREKEGE